MSYTADDPFIIWQKKKGKMDGYLFYLSNTDNFVVHWASTEEEEKEYSRIELPTCNDVDDHRY